MVLYLIGIGLNNEKSISLEGLELVKKADKIYLENYTSLLQCSKEDLEQFYGQKIIIANREMTEQGEEHILDEAKNMAVAFLVIGDPFSATTHIELYKSAISAGIPIKIINNASVLTAIGITGLQLYKFGKTTSIPFIEDHPNLETPYHVLADNQKLGLHTLLLLDLKPAENKFMTVNQALQILEKIESQKQEQIINQDTLMIGCARLGTNNPVIRTGTVEKLKQFDFGLPPHCLIIPGKLHFAEEEMLNLWKN